MRSLHRCLNPRTIAVVGGTAASKGVRESLKLGFEGEIWAVNPGLDTMEGVACYSSLAALPGVPDATLVGVAAEATIEIVEQLAAMDAGGAICYASGFREVGEDDRHRRLLAAAGDMPIMGPNCYGFINAMNGAVLWPDWHGLGRVDTGVAIFTGSGNLAVNISMQNRSLPIALLGSVGNQAMIGMEQLLESVIEDDRITAIGLHIEGLKNLPMFIEVAIRAAERGKPIVVLKTGRSEAGARIALSHTATLAGGAELYDSLFERLGVVQVRDLETFLEALRLLSVHGRMRGPRIASMSCSGGEASLLADLAQDTCLEFPDITPDQRVALKETLNDYVVISNPLDYHTFIWGDWARMQQTFTAMLAGNYDLTLLLLDFPTLKEGEVNEWALAGEAFAAACEETGQAGAVVSSLAESMPVAVRESLLARSVVPMLGTQQAVAVIAACAAAREIVQPVPIIPAESQPNPERKSISEHAAKELLGEYGLSAAGAVLVSELDSAVAAADKIGYPVVLKASVEGLSHKTEVGGVVLNVENAEQVREHGRRLLALGGDLLVEKMLSAGVAELLLGISHDSQFGHYLVIGCGGTLVELIADSQLLLLPASDRQIREALGRLRMAKLLQGYRGAPAADIDAIVRSAQGLAALVADQRDTLLEVDINPLIVGAQGSGAMVADALIVYRS